MRWIEINFFKIKCDFERIKINNNDTIAQRKNMNNMIVAD